LESSVESVAKQDILQEQNSVKKEQKPPDHVARNNNVRTKEEDSAMEDDKIML